MYNDIRKLLDDYQQQVLTDVSDEELKKMIQLMGTIRTNIVEN
ncbi:MAG TPA: hypothetical protein VNU45_17625 [Rummeliibacillus sp.]|nr:hypothetical protein [Rummeliibacillus sp.]